MKKPTIPQPKPSTKVLCLGALSMVFWLAIFATAGALIGFVAAMGYLSDWAAGFSTAVVCGVCVYVCGRVYRVTGEMYAYALRFHDHG